MMLCADRARTFWNHLPLVPLVLLRLSLGKRVFLVLLSYGIGIPGLWVVFPQLHNGASMLLPVICLCWLFSYRGVLLSLGSTAGAIVLVASFVVKEPLSDPGMVERAGLGLGMVLVLGLVICWLRKAVDLVAAARQLVLTTEQQRLLAVERAQHATSAYEQQRKINELKDHFLLHVSHELRTPLTVLGGSLELLQAYHERLTPTERATMLDHALVSQQLLADFVHRVLDTTTAESDVPIARPQGIWLSAWLREVVSQVAPQEQEAYTICLQVPEQLMVWADPHLLRQVMQNLLSNIFKYVPRHTLIQIVASSATPTAPILLSVQDAGPGIPAEELALLFEKFVRLKRDVAGATRGTGLGLYLCQRYVEAMGGRIWVESSGRPGEGSRFCLTLPPFFPAEQPSEHGVCQKEDGVGDVQSRVS